MTNLETLKLAYDELITSKGRRYTRDAAKELGVSEAELCVALPGRSMLDTRFAEMVKRFGELDRAKVISRNENAVIEKWGRIEEIDMGDGHVGQIVGEDIDLRLFVRAWRTALLVKETLPKSVRTSLQIFDLHGDSVLKVFAETDEGAATLEAIAKDHASDGAVSVEPREAPKVPPQPSEETIAAFRADWDAMTDTHAFFSILRKHGLPRLRGLEVAGESRAREVPGGAFESLLVQASEREMPIMVFVGNRGALQIHSGPVKRITRDAGYLNVLDARFNLHVRDDRIVRAFVVRKPTVDGIVTSLEIFDAEGEAIALVFSKRKHHQPEQAWWGELCASLGEVR